jgi:hypothetical protein
LRLLYPIELNFTMRFMPEDAFSSDAVACAHASVVLRRAAFAAPLVTVSGAGTRAETRQGKAGGRKSGLLAAAIAQITHKPLATNSLGLRLNPVALIRDAVVARQRTLAAVRACDAAGASCDLLQLFRRRLIRTNCPLRRELRPAAFTKRLSSRSGLGRHLRAP